MLRVFLSSIYQRKGNEQKMELLRPSSDSKDSVYGRINKCGVLMDQLSDKAVGERIPPLALR